MRRIPYSGHRRAGLLKDEEHRAVPTAKARKVRGKALVEGADPAVAGRLDEAVKHARIERGVCCVEEFFRECFEKRR